MDGMLNVKRLRKVIDQLETCRAELDELGITIPAARVDEAIRLARKFIPPW